jgi:hypothetical protein
MNSQYKTPETSDNASSASDTNLNAAAGHSERTGPSPQATIILVTIVCLVGGVVGGYFGSVAGTGYGTIVYFELSAAAYPDPTARYNEEFLPGSIAKPADLQAFDRIGLATGIAAGLLAAHLWCRLMFWIARRSGYSRLVLHGSWVGLVAGIMATLVLHSVLWIPSMDVHTYPLQIGVVCALISGPIAGAVCGSAFKWITGPISTAGRESETIAA